VVEFASGRIPAANLLSSLDSSHPAVDAVPSAIGAQ
jgi:hypothetical protein